MRFTIYCCYSRRHDWVDPDLVFAFFQHVIGRQRPTVDRRPPVRLHSDSLKAAPAPVCAHGLELFIIRVLPVYALLPCFCSPYTANVDFIHGHSSLL